MGGATADILGQAGEVDVEGVHLLQGVSEAVVGAAHTVEVEEAVALLD
jgi:hypothetical protein